MVEQALEELQTAPVLFWGVTDQFYAVVLGLPWLDVLGTTAAFFTLATISCVLLAKSDEWAFERERQRKPSRR